MKLYKANKTVLRFLNNPDRFLNGLVSNTLDKPQNAFLNIHGRIIAVVDQIKVNQDEFWVIVETPFVDALLQHLDRYAKLSRVEIAKLDKHVYFDLTDAAIPDVVARVPQKKGRLVVVDRAVDGSVSDEEFTLFRLRNRIPLQGIDYKDEFLLNVSETDLVSFTKGCFLGQEPVAKVHNRSRPTWRLMVKYEDECGGEEKEKMTSKARDLDVNRVLGFVFVRND
jgi:folate-binding protein YgfZ